MHPHHRAAVERVTERLRADPEVQALLLAGSIAHGFAREDSDVDLLVVVGDDALAAIFRYPAVGKAERIARFHAQFEAWHWYAHEARKLGDRYLLGLAVSRTVLFGGRMILAHNERLFPYHKWFLRVLEAVPDRPADLMPRIAALHDDPSEGALLSFWATIKNFRAWEGGDRPWSAQFMIDSELGWLDGRTPVDDL